MNYVGETDTAGIAAPSTEGKTFGYSWLANFQPWERFSDPEGLQYQTPTISNTKAAFLLKFGELGFMVNMFLKGDHDKNIWKLYLSSENSQ